MVWWPWSKGTANSEVINSLGGFVPNCLYGRPDPFRYQARFCIMTASSWGLSSLSSILSVWPRDGRWSRNGFPRVWLCFRNTTVKHIQATTIWMAPEVRGTATASISLQALKVNRGTFAEEGLILRSNYDWYLLWVYHLKLSFGKSVGSEEGCCCGLHISNSILCSSSGECRTTDAGASVVLHGRPRISSSPAFPWRRPQ